MIRAAGTAAKALYRLKRGLTVDQMIIGIRDNGSSPFPFLYQAWKGLPGSLTAPLQSLWHKFMTQRLPTFSGQSYTGSVNINNLDIVVIHTALRPSPSGIRRTRISRLTLAYDRAAQHIILLLRNRLPRGLIRRALPDRLLALHGSHLPLSACLSHGALFLRIAS